MSCPSAAWVVVHKLDDFGGTIGVTEIERADRLVILRIDATLRLGIGGLGAILGESGECRTVFLILEAHDTFVEQCFWVVGFDMFLR